MNIAKSVTLTFSLAALVGGGFVVYYLSQMPENVGNKATGIISTAGMSESAVGAPSPKPTPDLVLFCRDKDSGKLAKNDLESLMDQADKAFWNYETKVMRITGTSARNGSNQGALLDELRESIEWYASRLREINLPQPDSVGDSGYRTWSETFRNKHKKIPEKCRRYYKKTLVDGSGTAPSR